MTQAFLENISALFEKNCEGISPLQKAIREQAWKRFLELGLPDKSLPGYGYFPFNQFYRQTYDLTLPSEIDKEQYASQIIPECRNSHIVFVNGSFSEELSNTSALPEEVVVLQLKDALHKYGNFLQMRLARILKEERDPLVVLNIAMVQMGLFLYIPQEVEVGVPIQCLHLICNEKSAIFNPRIHVFVGSRAKARFIYDHVCLKDFDYLSNMVMDLALEEGVLFEHSEVLSPSSHGYALSFIRASLKRDSCYKSLACGSPSRASKQDFRISLQGENASCDLKGINLLRGSRQADVNVHVEHAAANCQSNQLFKNVLMENSRASFEGKIFVQQKAQKTVAYQLNHNLLLGERAVSNSKPNLEIFADDVKASHGATVTQLDPIQLHYLRSRGICAEMAKRLLLEGFVLEMMENIACPAMKGRFMQVMEKSAG